eukprot:g3479.t1
MLRHLVKMTKLEKLRRILNEIKVDALVVGTADAHMSEYVPANAERRAWLTGFDGSAGTAVVTKSDALLWTDGRYFLQAESQLDKDWKLMKMRNSGVPTIEDWLASSLNAGQRVAADPYLVSKAWTRRLEKKLKKSGVQFSPLSTPLNDEKTTINPVDALWGSQQPPLPYSPVMKHCLKYAGRTHISKIQSLRKDLLDVGASATVITALDEIAWLFNIRGSDIACNPVAVSYAVVTLDKCVLFVGREDKNGQSTEAALLAKHFEEERENVEVDAENNGNGKVMSEAELERKREAIVKAKRDEKEEAKLLSRTIHVDVAPYVKAPETIPELIKSASFPPKLPCAKKDNTMKVVLDPDTCNLAIYQAVENVFKGEKSNSLSSLSSQKVEVIDKRSLLSLPKARKNKSELKGLADAHIRDGVAVSKFLCWLEKKLLSGETALTECSVSDRLEKFRRDESPDHFVSLSFDTIAGSGANGAIIHYKPEPSSCASLCVENMFLCDSGAQYFDGTTDVTRTIHLGESTDHERRCFTRVLQGHCALASAVFPQGTTGYQLDLLARSALWRDGLDYAHGTGHGVGAFLNVHEGPHGISFAQRKNEAALEVGMTVTVEPGYYEDGAFGIRHENVLVVVKAKTPHRFQNKQFLTLAPLTWVPFQTRMIDASMLSTSELNWLNDYNGTCREKLQDYLEGDALEWLLRETQRLEVSE